MSPKQPGLEQSTAVLLTLSKAAFHLSSACPNFLSPGDLSQGNSLHYFFLNFPGFQPLIYFNNQPDFLSICSPFHQAMFQFLMIFQVMYYASSYRFYLPQP